MISQDILQLIYEIKTAPIKALNYLPQKGFSNTKRFIRNRVRDYRHLRTNSNVGFGNINSDRLKVRAQAAQTKIDAKTVALNKHITATQKLAKQNPNEIATKLKEKYHSGKISADQYIRGANISSQRVVDAKHKIEADKSVTNNPVETRTFARTRDLNDRRDLYNRYLTRP